MKPYATSVVVLGLLVLGAALEGGEAKKTDKVLLQGTWHAVAGEERGKPEPDAREYTMIFKGDRFKVERKGDVIVEGTFRIDPSKEPRTIDMTITGGKAAEKLKGKTALGIYELKKNELKWAAAEPGREERPKSFTTAGTSHMMIVFERESK